jgi:hypothetical protein
MFSALLLSLQAKNLAIIAYLNLTAFGSESQAMPRLKKLSSPQKQKKTAPRLRSELWRGLLL